MCGTTVGTGDHHSVLPWIALILPFFIIFYFSRHIPWQLYELVMIFNNRHASLFESKEFLLFQLHQPSRNMVRAKSIVKFLPTYGVSFSTAKTERLPPVKSSPLQLPSCIQNFLSVITLYNLKLPLNCMKPVISLERVSGMLENKWVCISISIPIVLHVLSHLLQ